MGRIPGRGPVAKRKDRLVSFTSDLHALMHVPPPSPCMQFVHFLVVMIMAARLPEEYRAGGDRVLILAAPIVIGVLALSWILLAFFDEQRR